jgi:regulator of sirC expression with transglutaminase-like and TPR domain
MQIDPCTAHEAVAAGGLRLRGVGRESTTLSPMQSDPTRRFADLAALPDDAIDVAEGALLIASEETPELDVASYLERLDWLAERLRPATESAQDELERVAALNEGLFEELGFRGNRDDYEDPRNSFLNEVIDRRTGIPITLSIVYVEVARRVGLRASGIGFPGHFLAKIESVPAPDGNDELVVDPFFGRTLSLVECQERLRQAMGPGVQLGPDSLRAATPREILTRVLSNLKNNHLRRGEPLEALSCIDRILMLAPHAPLEYRDRGLINEQLGFNEPARADLERFLELAPLHETAGTVRSTLERLGHVRTLVH